MPNTGTRAMINDLALPVYNVQSSMIHKATTVGNFSQVVTDRGNNNTWSLEAIIEDDAVYRRLHEFCGNASWTAAVTFASLAEDALEYNGVYTLLNSNLTQGGETWAEGRWSFSRKYPRIQWMLDGTALTTDWDTLDSVTNDYTALRNYTIDGGVTDEGTFINLTALDSLLFGEWWDSTIDWSSNIYGNGDIDDVRLCWRKCTAVTSRNGCYYLKVNTDNDTLEVHYIDTAGTDTTLYTYAYTMAASTIYTARIVTAGHRFDIYFGTEDAAEYLFTVFDDRLTAGRQEYYNGDAATFFRIYTVLLIHHKPLSALLPAGAYAWNDIPHQPMQRLSDNCTAYGRGQTVIAPQGNVSFKLGQSLANMPKTEGLWIFEGQDSIYDQSGHDRHMTTHTQSTGSHRYEQGVYQFPWSVKTQQETVTYYRWLNTTNTFTFTQGYTIHLLLKPLADSSSATGFCLQCYDGTHPPANIYLASDGHLIVGMEDSAGTDEVWDTAISPTLNEWQLWTITFDGLLTHTLYIDGVYQTLRTHATNLYFGAIQRIDSFGFTSATETLATNQTLLHILSYEQSAAEITDYARQVQMLRGDTAAVKVWDTNGEDGDWAFLEAYLTFDEGFSQQVYDCSKYNRAVTETSWTNKQNDGTDGWAIGADPVSGVMTSYHKNALYCYHLDGAADYVYMPLGGEDIESHGWTLGAWINWDASEIGASVNGDIMEIYDTTASGYTLHLYKNDTDKLVIRFYASTTVGRWYGNTSFVAGRWYFITVTWSGVITDDPLIYINGQLESVITEQNTPAGNLRDADRFYAGYITGVGAYFDGFMDDCFVYSKVLSAERILWLYQHMPALVDDSGWTQVFSADHQFRGDMIIDNGQIRLSQTFRQIDGSATYHTKLSPYIWGYSDGHWWAENRAYPYYYAAGTADYLETHTPWQLTKLDKYCVEVKGRVNSTVEWLQYKIAMTQSPLITITEDQYSLQGNVYLSMAASTWLDATAMGVQTAPRFMNTTFDTLGDTYINTDITGTSGASTGRGLSIGLHREVPLLWLFADTRYTTSVQGLTSGVAGQYSCYGFSSIDSIDFDADELPHQWLMGMVPFSQTNHVLEGSAANWNEATTEVIAAWGNIGQTTTFVSSVGALTTSSAITVAAAGAYRAWFFLAGVAGTEECTIAVTNAAYYNGSLAITNVPIIGAPGGAWYAVDCICGDADSINYTFQRTGADGTEVVCGEVVLIPISNSKNFPHDVWLHALKQSRITESASL